MEHKEVPTQIPPADERITLVLKAQEGSTLNQIRQFAQLGAPVSIGRGLAVIAGASDRDLQMELGEEREERFMQAELQRLAIGAPAHLAAHAQEMFDLLHRINVKVGGLNAVLGHGGEPSEQMWDEHNEAMDAIWDLLDKVQSAASVDKVRVNQIAETGESVNQTTQNLGSLITENPVVAESPYAAIRVKNIDLWIKTLENAKRYEWLRDFAFDTPRQDLVLRDKSGDMLIEQDLDGAIDRAMQAYPGDQEDAPCAE